VIFISSIQLRFENMCNCHYALPNCQESCRDFLQAMGSIYLNDEIIDASGVINITNITDGGVITMEWMLSCDYYLQSNQVVVSVLIAFDEAANRQ
jgi:hypothetical protein